MHGVCAETPRQEVTVPTCSIPPWIMLLLAKEQLALVLFQKS
jgi:hypothetical protein